MKFKRTLFLLAVFIVLFAIVYFFEFRNTGENPEEMLVDIKSEDIEKIIYRNGEQTIQFQRDGEEWMITDPIEATADKFEVDQVADDFSSLRIERVVEEDPSDLEKYGIPQKEMELHAKDQEIPIKILIGMENPLDNTFFAKREGETKVVLISSSLKSLLEKDVFDFRQKNIYKFETDQAKSIILRAQDVRWEAEKEEDDWILKKPIYSLAQKSKINDILYSLSNLKATAFVSENKNEQEIENYGLDKPDYEVAIDFPSENKQVTFFLQEKNDEVHVTSSLSPKIIQVEKVILTDLKKEVNDLRDKGVADFFTWEAKKIHLQKGEMSFSLTKDEEENWHFEDPEVQEADAEKIQSFLRKLESLECEEFVDPPLNLDDLGLANPQGEIKVWTGNEKDTLEEIDIQIGTEDNDSKMVYVKNERFPYVFKVDSAFLDEFPQKKEDWKKPEEPEKKEERD